MPARSPPHTPIEFNSLRRARVSPVSSLPIALANMDSTPASERVSASRNAALKGCARPSQFINEPDFSVTTATGNTTLARSVIAEW